MDTPIFRYTSLSEALDFIEGAGCTVKGERDLGGGCINSCSMLTLNTQRRLFIKRNKADGETMFSREASGLSALAAVPGAPPVPRVLAYGIDSHYSFLLMEYIEPAAKNKDFWEDFGRALARMHKNGRSHQSGFSEDNYIGLNPQINSQADDWVDFFRTRRLEYQLKLARDQGLADARMQNAVESVMKRLDQLLIPCDEGRASLLHGDLWSGNYVVGPEGRAYIIDPAVYYGHREADLAMTRLFASYDPAFYGAYNEEWPLAAGSSRRYDLYNLYHLLNHLNLFGSSYKASVLSIACRYA